MTWKEPEKSRTPVEQELHERILGWQIQPGDKVIVIGGYQGIVCALMLERYPGVDLYTWEPQPIMYQAMIKRFAGVSNIHIFNYGLGERTGTFPMTNYGNDGCSYLIPPDRSTELMAGMVEFDYEMSRQSITEIALLHMNIEGYEYVLLPHLFRTGWFNHIDQLMISTHGIHEPAWTSIVKGIEQTHHFEWTMRGFYGWRKK